MISNLEVNPDLPYAIIDVGSSKTKCFVSHYSDQRYTHDYESYSDDFPSLCCWRNRMAGMMSGGNRSAIIGEGCYDLPIQKWRSPIDTGRVNYNDLEMIYHHTFYNILRAVPEDHRVMISSVPPFNTNAESNFLRNSNEKLTAIMFETFNVPGLSIVDPAVAAIHISGNDTGCVLEIGHSLTRVVPIYKSLPIQHAQIIFQDPTIRMDPITYETKKRISGDLITDCFIRLLSNSKRFEVSKGRFQGNLDRVQVSEMKDELCYLTTDPYLINCFKRGVLSYEGILDEYKQQGKKLDLGSFDKTRKTRSHDDSIINYTCKKIGSSRRDEDEKTTVVKVGCERYLAPEILFHPSLIGYELPGIHHIINLAIQRCPKEIQAEMYQNIVLSGGTTMVKNFEERLRIELRAILPSHIRFNVFSLPDGSKAGIEGMKILAESPCHDWINRDYYEENGARVVHRVCQFVNKDVPLVNLGNMKWIHSDLGLDEDVEERTKFLLKEFESSDEEKGLIFKICLLNRSFDLKFKYFLML